MAETRTLSPCEGHSCPELKRNPKGFWRGARNKYAHYMTPRPKSRHQAADTGKQVGLGLSFNHHSFILRMKEAES